MLARGRAFLGVLPPRVQTSVLFGVRSVTTEVNASTTPIPPPTKHGRFARPIVAQKANLEPSPQVPATKASTSRVPTALTVPRIHPRTHGIPVAIIHLRSPHANLLELFIHFTLHAAYGFGIPCSRAASLPTQRSLYTVLRSPFVHKKSQENFEKIVRKRAIKVWDTDPEVLSRWIKYLEINMLPGVGMRIVKWERAEIGFGERTLAHVEEENKKAQQMAKLIGASGGSSQAQMQLLANQIIQAELEVAAEEAENSASVSTTESSKPSSSVTDETTSDAATPASVSTESKVSSPTSTSPDPTVDIQLEGHTDATIRPEDVPLAPATDASVQPPPSEASASSSSAPSETVVSPSNVEISTPTQSTPPKPEDK